MAALSVIRHQSVFDPSRYSDLPLHIVGAGATGSRVFMALLELGLTNITVWDYDIVEAHNLANQAYLHHHIGLPKVDALKDLVALKTGNAPFKGQFRNERVTDQQLEGVVFLLTDTMASRREIMENQSFDTVLWVFETRMAATHGNVVRFNPHSRKERQAWFDSLISDEGGEISPCGTSISVGPTASLIANMVVWEFINTMLDDGCATPRTECFFKPLMINTFEAV